MADKLSPKQRFIVSATVIGNALEWFDFTLFALMAPLITKIFFPERASSVLYLVLMFVVVAIARPLGGVVFGYIGDRTGRKSALFETIVLMTIPIFLIAVLPSYEKIGISATIGLAFILIFQGFSLGGEFPGTLVFLSESSSQKMKGYMGSWSYFGIFLGMFFAATDFYLLNTEMPLSDLEDWGWRLPFFIGGVVGIVSIFLRRLLRETPFFQEAKQFGYLVKEPILYALHKYKKMILQGIGIFILDTVGFNLILIFSSSYLQSVIGLSSQESFQINLFTIAVLLVCTPLMGKLSIRIGTKRMARWAALGMLLAAFPAFLCMGLSGFGSALICQGVLAFLLAGYLSNLPALICSLFPVEVRYSGTSLAINLAIGVFGALGPLIMSYVIIELKMPILSAIYLSLGAAIALFTLSTMKENGEPLQKQIVNDRSEKPN